MKQQHTQRTGTGRRHGQVAAAFVAVLAIGAGATSAGIAGAAAAAPESQPADLGSATLAWTAPTQPTFVNRDYGLLELGDDFGLSMSPDDLQTFDSHAVATQTVLSGQVDVLGGSFVSTLLVNQQGQDFKAFCPFIKNDDFVLVVRGEVESISALFDDEMSVAIDSPGGAGDIILNAMLQANGEERTVQDLPGAQILESSGLRTSAFVGGEVDATLVHLTQYEGEILPVVPEATIVSTMYEDIPIFVKEALAAPTDWLDENIDLAAAICAAIVQGSRDLAADEDLWLSAVEEYVEEPAGPEELSLVFPLLTDAFWPIETGITEESLAAMSDAAIAAGVLEEAPAYEDVVDPRPMQMALEMIDG